jgi:hypothetical protein
MRCYLGCTLQARTDRPFKLAERAALLGDEFRSTEPRLTRAFEDVEHNQKRLITCLKVVSRHRQCRFESRKNLSLEALA